MKTVDYDFASAKEEYRAFCERGEHDIQLFALPWYLDAVCDSPDDWQVITYKENGKIIAAFPFQYKKGKRGWWTISNPWQAPRLGIWIDYGNRESNAKRETLENTITEFVIQNLPYFDAFCISFDARYRNRRKFYENGFSQETRYSYVILDEQVSSNYLQTVSKHRRKAIERAKDLFSIKCSDALEDIDEYWNFFIYSYELRERKPAYSEEKAKRLFQEVLLKKHGRLYFAKDCENGTCAQCIVFYDSRRYYAMYGTFHPTKSDSARELLTYQAIQDCAQDGKDYDFEGSMIPGVAQYDREFNAELEPYFVISKYSPRMKFYINIRENMTILKNWILRRTE